MNAKKHAVSIAMSLALATSALPLYAQAQSNAPNPGANNVNWNTNELRNGISADRLVGMDARGKNGDSVGEVQHIIVNTDGKVSAVVIESQGFANIGDVHIRVPWNEVQFGRDKDHIIVPITEQTAQRYQERSTAEKAQLKGGEVRLSEFQDKEVWLSNSKKYGSVQDFILSRKGEVKAVIVDADFGPGGLRAYPFTAVKFNPGNNRIDLAFDESQANRARGFDYRAFGIDQDRPRSGATQGRGGTGSLGGEGARPPRAARG